MESRTAAPLQSGAQASDQNRVLLNIMPSGTHIDRKQIAFYDPERKGMFIHADQLLDSPFEVGDRFSLRKGRRELFAITIIKNDRGDIFFDKQGIFIERTRKIDILLGGIFEEYVFYIEPEIPATIKLKPLEIVKDTEQKWR